MVSIEHDALKRFVRATEEFEGRFASVVVGLSGPWSQTGERYIEYLNGRSRVPATIMLPTHDLPDEAFPSADAATDATFARLAETNPANSAVLTLFWRIKPEIDYSERRKGYVTYCRFLISDKPRTNG